MIALDHLTKDIISAIKSAFDHDLAKENAIISPTKKEFDGDYTFVVFPLVRALKSNPVQIAETIGNQLVKDSSFVNEFNVVKGFLNLSMSADFWKIMLDEIGQSNFGQAHKNGKKIMIEFSSPNTNKPLHLGHIRNILLGWSMSQIAEANGYDVIKTQVVNDRGIAVCKSMMAWQMFADGATPESTNTKGDHFVGDYYVKFDKALQAEYKAWQETGAAVKLFNNEKKTEEDSDTFFKRFKNQYFNEHSDIGKNTKQMLLQWEENETEVRALWEKMNGWVYDGFATTYKALGVSFDTINYESETYLLGKKTVEEGISGNIFYQKDDGSVWIDLEDAGMDQKLVLRSDGTSVYMTQDLGTAQMRYADHGIDSMVYVVGDEQDYHFKVLFEILKRLGEPYADQLFHLSYGMVDLPTGKMKSREGTVVDADDLIRDVINEAKESSEKHGALGHLSDEEKQKVYNAIGLAALKYFIIKVSPRKRMTFDPKASVDMQGTTGPYIQNAYVRIQSIKRKADKLAFESVPYDDYALNMQEKELLVSMASYGNVLKEAMDKYDPSLVANFAYALAKQFHRYYHDNVILDQDEKMQSSFRLALSQMTSAVLKKSMSVIGIDMPDFM